MRANSLQILLFAFLLVGPISAATAVDLVTVNKAERRMYLLEQGQVVREFQVALGRNPVGHKQQEGDQRTPEGRYRLDYVKEDSAYHRSMHISYPNDEDRARAKAQGVEPGGFIMVHGQRNGFGWLGWLTQRFNWTQGCIALTNQEMDEFLARVPVGTEILIKAE